MTERVSQLETDVKKLINEGNKPPPSPSRPFVISFGDGVTLSPKAPQMIDEAADSAKTATTIFCNGYSDTMGDDTPRGRAINITISDRRADVVAKELIRRGIPAENIKSRGYGSHAGGRTVEIFIVK